MTGLRQNHRFNSTRQCNGTTRLPAASDAARRYDRLRQRRRPVARRRRRRRRAPADGRARRAVDPALSPDGTVDRVRRPRRAASGGVRDGRGRRARAAADVARPRRHRARLHAATAACCSSPRTASRSSATTARGRADPAGGMPTLLPLGQVNHLAYGPGKAMVIGRNTADPARWKRYRGGTAGHLWIDAKGSGTFRRMSELAGNITSPMWIGERIYYLSDAEGIGNLYSCRPDGSDPRRHTDHADYLRAARADRRTAHRLPVRRATCGCTIRRATRRASSTIRVPSHRTQAARRFVAAADHLESALSHPAGHSAAVIARGRLFTFPLWEGAVRQHGDTPTARASPRPVARRRHDDRRGQRRERRGAHRGARERRDRACSTGTSAAWSRCAPHPRGRRARASPTIATRCWSATSTTARSHRAIAATPAARRTSRGRRTAPGSRIRSGRPRRATARSSCTTSRAHGDARHARRSSATTARRSTRGPLPVLPVDPHVRSGLRQRAVRAVASRARRGPYLIALQARARSPFEPEPKGLTPDEPRRDDKASGRGRRR